MANRKWEIIGAPFDYGAAHKGSGEGPAVVRGAGLTRRIQYLKRLGFDVVDGGDVDPPGPNETEEIPRGLQEMSAYAPSFMERLDASLRTGAGPLVLAGDHSLSILGISAVGDFVRSSFGSGGSVGVIWVDAHDDMETPGPDSTNDLNAMPIAHLLDRGVPELGNLRGFAPKPRPEDLIYIGLRDAVPEERQAIHDLSIRSYAMIDLERHGIVKVCEEAFEYMNEKTDAFVLSFDVDVLDPLVAPGADYPEPAGLTLREALVIMEYANKSSKLAMCELVEVNPWKDRNNTTSRAVIELIHRLIYGTVL